MIAQYLVIDRPDLAIGNLLENGIDVIMAIILII